MELTDYKKAYYELLDAAGIHNSHTHTDVLKYMRNKDRDHYNLTILKRHVEKLCDIAEQM